MSLARVLLPLLLLAQAIPAPAQTHPAEGSLRPGDAIKLTIWLEPEMSGEILVQEDGRAVFPRLGPLPVAGRDIDSLKREIIEEYGKTLLNPSIEIIVIRRVTISGEVRTPGVFRVDPSMTLTEALALAGGPSPGARRDRIILVRDGQSHTIKLDRAMTMDDLAVRSGDQIYVPQRTWLARNWGVTLTTVTTVVGLTLTLLAR